MARQKIMTERKKRLCEMDAEIIAFYRRNPCIACEEILGVKLIDSQKYILQMSWNTPHVLWCCSRNFGKSFLGAILMILKAVLYENQAIYIVSSVGSQSKETFTKLEEIVLRMGKAVASMRFGDMPNYIENETVKSANNKSGFSHSQEGYHVEFFNGSEIFTLNGNPDNNRSRRASMVFFDEAAFSSDELLSTCEAFATQSTEFVTGIDENFNPDSLRRKVPTQLVYASSQDSMDKMFYKHYKTFAKQMLAGNRDYFVCDMICDTAITTYMNGRLYNPLLTQAKVDTAMKANRNKALREYYNLPTLDGGQAQIVKWGVLRRNETFLLPELQYQPNCRYIMAFDPSRTNDNSIFGVMKVVSDPDFGYIGEIINCENFVDSASKRGYKLDSNRQLDGIREYLYKYSDTNYGYENIEALLIDAGAGGGGVSTYADGLLNDWTDKNGRKRKGLIDKTHEIYKGYDSIYPNAIDKVRVINPKKYRTQMIEEFIELMNMGAIKFPYDFKNEYVQIPKGDVEDENFITYQLSTDEILALESIYIMKEEITSIYKSENKEKTTVSYALPKDKENKMHDDRFYVAILMAHQLYQMRRGETVKSEVEQIPLSNSINLVSSISFDL